ncbi:MAG: hypothetical protein ACRDSM_21530, partial [Pseudonocardiaceae bacterium]
LVRGLTGLGAYLLRRDPGGDLVGRVLAYLVALTEPLAADDDAARRAGGPAIPPRGNRRTVSRGCRRPR